MASLAASMPVPFAPDVEVKEGEDFPYKVGRRYPMFEGMTRQAESHLCTSSGICTAYLAPPYLTHSFRSPTPPATGANDHARRAPRTPDSALPDAGHPGQRRAPVRGRACRDAARDGPRAGVSPGELLRVPVRRQRARLLRCKNAFCIISTPNPARCCAHNPTPLHHTMRCFPHAPDALGHRAAASHICLVASAASHAWFQGRLQCFTTHPFAHSSRSTHPRPPPHPTPPHLPSAPLAPLARRRHAPPLLTRRSSRSRRARPRSSSRGSPPRTQCGWARF